MKRMVVGVVIVAAGTMGLAGTADAADYGSAASNAAPLGPAGAYVGSVLIDLSRFLNSVFPA